jgi:CelD/BcsL family acetyltransferase involved in cellulose biosynthesis
MSARYKIVRDAEALAALVPEWRQFWRRMDATLFQSPDWLTPWWDIFAPGELRIVTVREGDKLIGLAPLYREHGRFGSRLLPIGISLSDYVDVLLDPQRADAAAIQISSAIADMHDMDELELGELRPDSAAFGIPAPPGWQSVAEAASVCPVLRLPHTVKGLREVIPPSRLRHLRAARN